MLVLKSEKIWPVFAISIGNQPREPCDFHPIGFEHSTDRLLFSCEINECRHSTHIFVCYLLVFDDLITYFH